VLGSSCSDAEDERKGLEADAIESFTLPDDFTLIDSFEGGNGGGGPTIVYEFEGIGEPSGDQVTPAAGYEKLALGPTTLRSYIPSLDSTVPFEIAGDYIGPASNGVGECLVTTAISRTNAPSLLSLSAACDIDGPLASLSPR